MECQRRNLTPVIIYRLMVSRSRILWGEKVHRFYQIAGTIHGGAEISKEEP